MKILKERNCPCCKGKITYKDYMHYLELNSGDGREPILFSCVHCNHVILSTREYNKWAEGTSLVMLYAFIGLFYFVKFNEPITYIAHGVLLVIWVVLQQCIPFIFAKFKCYSNKEINMCQQEGGTPGFIIFAGTLLFYGLIFFIFYTLATEYKNHYLYQQKSIFINKD